MLRELFALFLGFVLWTAAWSAGGTLLAAVGGGEQYVFNAPETQAMLLIYCVVCSVATGLFAGVLCRCRETILLLGILIVAPYPFLFVYAAEPVPLSFSVPFILAIVPSVFLGAQLVTWVARRVEEE